MCTYESMARARPRVERAWLLCAMVACSEAPEKRAAAPTEEPGGPELKFSPHSIDFGLVKLGETAAASLTVRNSGDEAIDVDALLPSNDAVIVDDPGPFHLEPGEEQVRTLHWTAMRTDELWAQIDVVVVDLLPATVTVPVFGQPAFGALSAQLWLWEGVRFGSVAIGCEREVSFEIYNQGFGELNLESVTLSGPDEFTMEVEDNGELAGRVLAPDEAVSLRATFTPTAPVSSEATIHIESDDPLRPEVDAPVTGLGVAVPETVSLTYYVSRRPTALTSLIDVNAQVAPDMHEAFDAFFEVLRASEIPFRVAILGKGDSEGDLDPSVAGPYAYIDDTFSADQSHDAVDAMLDGIGGDEDRGLALLDAAVVEHRDWLIDEDSTWQSSMLHLTVVNADAEQSPLSAETYVAQYWEYKGDPALVAVNGIAGRPPAGCGDGVLGAAEPSQLLLDATEASGGSFQSICGDWNTTHRILAARLAGIFPLTDPPFDSAITVTLDGKEIDSGWVYDPKINAIRFDDDSYPAEGSIVGIEYGVALVCD